MTQSNDVSTGHVGWFRGLTQKAGIYTSLFRLVMKVNRKWGFDTVPHMDVFGDDDLGFMSAYQVAKQRSLLSQDKLFLINQCARQVAPLPGEWAELGVFQGGSAYLLSRIKPRERPLHLFDTFAGNPRKGIHDTTAVGDFANTSEEAVREFVNDPSVVIHKGDVIKTLEQVSTSQFSFVHLDLDVYESTMASLEFLYPRMKQGIMVFDDYPIPGIKNAIADFFKSKPEVPIPQRTGQCLVVKF